MLGKGWFTLKAEVKKSSGKAESAKKTKAGKLVHTKSGKQKKKPKQDFLCLAEKFQS